MLSEALIADIGLAHSFAYQTLVVIQALAPCTKAPAQTLPDSRDCGAALRSSTRPKKGRPAVS
jgi:hypothetical protein